MLINLLNPKAYIFFLVVAPEFMRGAALGVRNALLLSLISAAIATMIHFIVVVAGSKAHGWLSDPRRTKVVRRVFAAVMLAVAVSFLVSDFG
jgi:threonine/homoserine/homoserine lactone efflux protein